MRFLCRIISLISPLRKLRGSFPQGEAYNKVKCCAKRKDSSATLGRNDNVVCKPSLTLGRNGNVVCKPSLTFGRNDNKVGFVSYIKKVLYTIQKVRDCLCRLLYL